VYALGDKLGAPQFQQAVNNSFIDYWFPYCVGYELIISAFGKLHTTCPILAYMVDSQCSRWYEEMDTGNEEEMKLRSKLPHDFLVRVMIRYSQLVKDPSLKQLDRCSYHTHTSKKERTNCKRKWEREGRDETENEDESEEGSEQGDEGEQDSEDEDGDWTWQKSRS